MKTCHVCKEVCEDFETLCPKCGANLEDTVEETTEATEKEIKNPVLAATVNDPITAEIFGDVLKDNNIPYALGEENGAMHIGFGGGFIAVDVYVDESDLEAALKIYREVLESDNGAGEFEEISETEE